MSLDTDTALAIIKHAEKELVVKQQEISLEEKREETRRFEIEQNTTVALAQISAQAEDLKDNRVRYNSMLARRYWFAAVITLFVLVFAAVGISLGAKDAVLEILKVSLAFAAGGFGGFHYGKAKQEK